MSTAQLPDALSGKLSHVATVAKDRTGKKPSPATIWRWCKRGLRGGTIKLAAVYHGGYWQTTPEAFNAFLAAQTEAAFITEAASASDDDLRNVGLL